MTEEEQRPEGEPRAETVYSLEVGGKMFKSRLTNVGRRSYFIIERFGENKQPEGRVEITGLTRGFSKLLDQASEVLKHIGE